MSAMTSVHDVVRISRKVIEYPEGTPHSDPYAATTFCFESESPFLGKPSRFQVTVFHPIGLEVDDTDVETR